MSLALLERSYLHDKAFCPLLSDMVSWVRTRQLYWPALLQLPQDKQTNKQTKAKEISNTLCQRSEQRRNQRKKRKEKEALVSTWRDHTHAKDTLVPYRFGIPETQHALPHSSPGWPSLHIFRHFYVKCCFCIACPTRFEQVSRKFAH